MKRSIGDYVEKRITCQQVKVEHQRLKGLLKPLEIPKGEKITMDFMVGLSRTIKENHAIWVIVDRLTKSAHFLTVKLAYSMKRLAKIYVEEIVRLHGLPVHIVTKET